MFKVGDKVNIKPEAWARYLKTPFWPKNIQNPSPQKIVEIYDYGNFGIDIVLAFPLYYFKDTDFARKGLKR